MANKTNCDSCALLVDWGNNPTHFGYRNEYLLCGDCTIKMNSLLKVTKKRSIDAFISKLTFGQTIRAAREKKGITQQELLKLIRGKYFSPSYMSKVEVDGSIPSVYRIIDLADVLDLDQRDLWELAKSEKIEAYSLKLSKLYERARTRHWETKLKK